MTTTDPTPLADGGPLKGGGPTIGQGMGPHSAPYLIDADALAKAVDTFALAALAGKVGPLLQSRATPVVHLPTDPPPPPTCVYKGHRIAWFGTDDDAHPVCVRCGADL